MTDQLAGIDPTDIHFQIARLPAPPALDADNIEITYQVGSKTYVGPGSISATVGSVSAAMAYDDPLQPGEMRTLNAGSPGKLISHDRFGTLTGTSAAGEWSASGAYVTWQGMPDPMTDPWRSSARFRLDDITLTVSKPSPEVAYTRLIYMGPRLTFLSGCMWTPVSQKSTQADRTEERAFDRRITLRDLREKSDDRTCPTAIIHDGPPLDEVRQQALWLATSLFAGAALQPAVVETYDDTGTLIERKYRPGFRAGVPGRAPFDIYYARYQRHIFGLACDRIYALLTDDFPIDVVISHLHDATDGSMERQMQSCLFAIHTASEAWNRLHERTYILDVSKWDSLKQAVAAAARSVADAFDIALGDSVRGSVLNANNTSTGSRLRLFFRRKGLKYEGSTKKAIELRNKLFHDGYLQRRFLSLDFDKQQERYDQLQHLQEFSLRMIFALCEINVPIHGILNPYGSLQTIDAIPDPT